MDRYKLVEKLFPTIELAYKQKHPTHLEIPMVMPQFLIKSYSLFYLFMRKLANERVSAVERIGEATSEQHVNKGNQQTDERGDEQVAHFWRPDLPRSL